MKNLITDHPSERVRIAAIRLLDALCEWERDTGRQNLVIIKDSSGCECRILSGAPQPACISDAQLLEVYANVTTDHPAML